MPVTYIEGIKPCQDAKVAIVVSRFNSFICERLLEGALDTLKREGQVSEDNITVVRVPGAIESTSWRIVDGAWTGGLTNNSSVSALV